MKAIVLMFDSLNRHMLPPYGCDWTVAPNFKRLAQRSLTFTRSYVCSMPCMPARRDFHTARPNFLHRSWGPLEPFDDSVPAMLAANGVSSHLISDHYHYWEDGGCTYHNRYSTWDFSRGQEGDPWIGQVKDPAIPSSVSGEFREKNPHWRQDWVNRQVLDTCEKQPQARTFASAFEFLRRNHDQDRWFLQIETFDPHEPFFTHKKYKDLYPHDYKGKHFDWPPYRGVQETPQEVEHCRYEYAALLSMCDDYLGRLMDLMDELNMWRDTMLVVWTDHGFMLGEHDCWAKCWQPWYEELAHTPFFVWDPRSTAAAQQRHALVQPALDIGPTLLDFFGFKPTADMLGKPLTATLANDAPVRNAAIFGLHGAHVNVTDGRYVYMRGPTGEQNRPLFQYTLMPTHMNSLFSTKELASIELAEPLPFTKGCKVMKIPHGGQWVSRRAIGFPTMLFDLKNDPQQKNPINDPAIEAMMIDHLMRCLKQADAPPEQYERLGLPRPALAAAAPTAATASRG